MRSLFVKLAVGPALLVLAVAAPTAAADTIRVQSTTDTVDAGLVGGLLIPGYKAAHPEDTIAYTAVGTGKALDNARAGQGDVVVTHAPSLERQFSADGFSLEGPGRAIFYSDYVIVGPKDDPAGVAAGAPHDAARAYELIAAAGGAGTADFVARGTNSGTDVENEQIWGLASVEKHKARDAGTDTSRFEPGPGPSPSTAPWYHRSTLGQASNLSQTSACPYASGKCYTILDRGTYNLAVNNGTITNLKIVSENNDPGARGGKDLLINPFSAYIVNPSKVPSVNVAAARRFIDYLVSPGFQNRVDSFPTAAEPAFHQDAFPSFTLRSALPRTGTVGKKVTLSLLVTNRQPGAPAINGLPVQIQQSTDGAKTWKNIGGAKGVSNGVVTFQPTIPDITSRRTRAVRFRTSMGLFQSTSYNAFSPNTQDVGLVSIPADKSAPAIIKSTFTRGRVSFVVGEATTIKISIRKRTTSRVRSRTVVKYRQVKSASGKTKKAGRFTRKLHSALSTGTYHVGVRVTDHAGNVKRVTKTVKVKPTRRHRR